jgi:hypothetical protein
VADAYRAQLQAPRGGVQANDDRHRRDVRWWYDYELKDPPENLYSLANEYAKGRRAAGVHIERDQRATIRKGIERAEQVLQLGVRLGSR